MIERTKTKVVIVGAGFSGLCAGIQLKQRGIHDFVIIEKSHQVGGTWWENQYPGAECDVESHLYCYSFEPYPNWSRIYSGSKEIHQYLVHVATKYQLYSHIKFEEIVEEFQFDEKNCIWTTKSSKGKVYESDFVIYSAAPLHHANIPDIPGIKEYEGKIIHTCKWDPEYDFSNKSIGMIGCAASGIQVAPQLRTHPGANLVIFQRTPQWIFPKGNRDYTEFEKWIFRNFPLVLYIYRMYLYYLHEFFFNIFYKGSWFNAISAWLCLRFMNRAVKNKELLKRITPKYPIGCKRILGSDDFFRALNKSNVEMVTDPIDKITKNSVISLGKEYKIDVLVLATGFDLTAGISSLKFTNPSQQAEIDESVKDPHAYYGVYLKGMKNFFILLGYNSGSTYTSIILYIEGQVNHIMQVISHMDQQKQKTVMIHPKVFNVFNNEMEEKSKVLVLDQCKSWYLKNDKNYTIYPDTVGHFNRKLSELVLEEKLVFQ